MKRLSKTISVVILALSLRATAQVADTSQAPIFDEPEMSQQPPNTLPLGTSNSQPQTADVQFTSNPPIETTIFGEPVMSQQAPNTLLLGSSTGIIYDSNVLNSQPQTADVQFTFNPLIGLTLARPRWGAVMTFAPGLVYSSADLPQYRTLSLTSTFALNYQPSPRLSLDLANNFVSSSNPFNSLLTNSNASQGSVNTGTTAAGNYVPTTNEVVALSATYGLSARTSLITSMSYNYVNYQHNNDIPDVLQPFQTSSSTQASISFSYKLTPKYSESVQYTAQFLSAGQGTFKTLGQSIQYGLAYSPTSALRISGMIGPEFVGNTFGTTSGNGNVAGLIRTNTSGWTWTGNLAVSEILGKNQFSVNASTQLGLGTQYQGNVRASIFEANYKRRVAGKTDLVVFGSYNINRPVFLAQLAPTFLSNNYASAGTTLSRVIAQNWAVSCAYWYLFQNRPGNGQQLQLYSGDHNRVAISLTYSTTRPLSR